MSEEEKSIIDKKGREIRKIPLKECIEQSIKKVEMIIKKGQGKTIDELQLSDSFDYFRVCPFCERDWYLELKGERKNGCDECEVRHICDGSYRDEDFKDSLFELRELKEKVE